MFKTDCKCMADDPRPSRLSHRRYMFLIVNMLDIGRRRGSGVIDDAGPVGAIVLAHIIVACLAGLLPLVGRRLRSDVIDFSNCARDRSPRGLTCKRTTTVNLNNPPRLTSTSVRNILNQRAIRGERCRRPQTYTTRIRATLTISLSDG
jgi:hypothetical protein